MLYRRLSVRVLLIVLVVRDKMYSCQFEEWYGAFVIRYDSKYIKHFYTEQEAEDWIKDN